MSKKVKAIRNIIKKNHRGFSMVELLTAIGILGVLAGVVVFIMNSSSKTYSKLSVEAQLQSEAQLVANMITELAIDSMDAKNTVATSYSMNYDEAEGKILVLESVLNNVKKQYIVGKKTGANKLYLAERTYDATNSTWGALSEALLGDYIDGFSVDTSRVENENVLRFTLSYKKNGRNYSGNYQVLMRNRAYADKEQQTTIPEGGTLLALTLNPQVVYVDVVGDQVTQYYKDDVIDANKVENVTQGVEFTATVQTNDNSADKTTVDWTLERADGEVFDLSSDTSLQTYLTWNNKTKLFKQSPVDSFVVRASKTITLSDGSTPLTRSKTAMVLLRRIKGLSLYAISGSTQWKKEYEEYVTPGVPSTEAQGYASVGTNGQYMPMTIGATIMSSNIPYGGGLDWKIYQKTSAGTWEEVNNTALAWIQDDETTTGTTNVVNFGSAVQNGQVYKVEAVSKFDNSWKAEYIFGIAPVGKGDGSGFYSRGYYTDMGALLKESTGVLHESMSPFSRLVFLKVTSVDAAGQNALSADKVKVIRDADGNWRLYVDFDAFAYSGEQKESFYNSDVIIHLTIGYYDELGNLCIDGSYSDTYVDELEQQEGRKVISDYKVPLEGGGEKTVYCKMSNDIKYVLGHVETTKVTPQRDLLVIAKGKSQSVSAKTSFYNILSPRNGMYYLGVYLDDIHNNMIEPGKGSTNAFFGVSLVSSYGDTNKYVDQATIQLEAKPVSAQKNYLTKPSFLRIAANDYYLVKSTPPNKSYTEYDVLIANVEDAEAYIAGPEATGRLAWTAEETSSITNGTKTKIKGYDSAGNEVDAKVYQSGKKYYCEYAGKTYTYNSTYNFWAN